MSQNVFELKPCRDIEYTASLCLGSMPKRRLDLRVREWPPSSGRLHSLDLKVIFQQLTFDLESANVPFTIVQQPADSLARPGANILRIEAWPKDFLIWHGSVLQRACHYLGLAYHVQKALGFGIDCFAGGDSGEQAVMIAAGAKVARFGFCDCVLIHDALVDLAGGSVSACVDELLESLSPTMKIMYSTARQDRFQEALAAGVYTVLLENPHKSMIDFLRRSSRGRVFIGSKRFHCDLGVDFFSADAVLQAESGFVLGWTPDVDT